MNTQTKQQLEQQYLNSDELRYLKEIKESQDKYFKMYGNMEEYY